ncbi:MAG: glycosyl hydrolase 115 family protein [Opitutaceae bacterium]
MDAAILVESAPTPTGAFPLVTAERSAPLWFDAGDWPGVIRAVGDLQADIERVTTRKPAASSERPVAPDLVLIGTLGRNAAIDALVASGKLDVRDLAGKWESFVITTVADPWPGVQRALVIAGSDKRGTIYGIYELSEQLGVSPWYWWADVPPRHRIDAYVAPGRFASGEPVVRYRGIFLNDEAPCLSGWTKEKFGGFNSHFYSKVFELLLRLRANYLWPAMWDSAFNEDDPANPRLADEYGIVMGTSHHEPMMRAHKEWTQRREQYGNGQWNYATNAAALQRFFREGIARNKCYENLVTVGMRGDGDEGMASTGTIESDIRQLEQIFTDQRRILAEEMQVDPATVPQLWALFTEVQKFYEHGLRPPDDVTLLWTDDNTGNLRRLPTPEERRRKGGAGIYYHLDMHGGPFAYQWINTNPFPKIAEQMNLAAEYGATRIWIANVGDLKPLELPIEFFLRLAWNPTALNKDKVAEYTRRWAERDFGPEHAAEIADLVARYTKYNGWRKPELITPETFSQLHFNEAERVEAAWREVVEHAEQLHRTLPAELRDAFFQLVLHPAKASALVAEMNIAAGRNRLYAKQGRAGTNAEAERVRELFRQDRALSDYYNHDLAGGKWNHLMDQAHLGQFDWEPPVVDVMPAVAEVLPRAESRFGVAVEGSPFTWPDHFGGASLPAFDAFQPRRSWIDVFAVGTKPIACRVSADQPWLSITPDRETPAGRRYWISVDWAAAPVGSTLGAVTIAGESGSVRVAVPVTKASDEQRRSARGRFASLVGPIAIAASAASQRTAVGDARWEDIPDYGRVTAAVGVYPVTAASILPPLPSPSLEFPVYLPRAGDYEVTLVLGPVMDFVPERGMRIAIAFDQEPPQVLDLFADRAAETFLGASWWARYTRDNARLLRSQHRALTDGPHTLRVSMVDPGIVVQTIIISDRRVPESYFGPPEVAPVN